MNPVEVGTWREVTLGGRRYLAMLSKTREGKFVAVVYVEPGNSYRYVRGESFTSIEEALELAESLLVPAPQLAAPQGDTDA